MTNLVKLNKIRQAILFFKEFQIMFVSDMLIMVKFPGKLLYKNLLWV
jgi:hypothetical protein